MHLNSYGLNWENWSGQHSAVGYMLHPCLLVSNNVQFLCSMSPYASTICPKETRIVAETIYSGTYLHLIVPYGTAAFILQSGIITTFTTTAAHVIPNLWPEKKEVISDHTYIRTLKNTILFHVNQAWIKSNPGRGTGFGRAMLMVCLKGNCISFRCVFFFFA